MDEQTTIEGLQPVVPEPVASTKKPRSGVLKTVLIVAAAIAIVGAAFYGGAMYGKSAESGRGGFVVDSGSGAFAGPGTQQGGPMGELTEEQRQAMEDMTEEERQQYMEEQFGGAIPGGAIPGANGPGMRGGLVEGEVFEVSGDTITIALADGGSQTIYTDEDTIMAYVEGVSGLAAGSQVMIQATPEADGVTTATLVVVTE